MKHFNQLLAKQFDPALFDLIGIRSSIRLAPLFGVLLDRSALSGGLRFARPPAIGWQPFRLPVPSRAPVVPPSHNLSDSPHEILRAARKYKTVCIADAPPEGRNQSNEKREVTADFPARPKAATKEYGENHETHELHEREMLNHERT